MRWTHLCGGLLLGWLVLNVAASPVLAVHSHYRYDDVEINVLDATPEASSYGYSEARFRLRNHSASRAHRVELQLPASATVATTALRRVSRTVELAPGATVEVSLLQPPLTSYGSGTGVVIDGQFQQELLSTFPAYGFGARVVLASRSIAAGDLDPALKVSPTEEYSLQTSPLAPDSWSEDWLAYSGFDGVILSEHEMASLRPGARAALAQYLQLGGTVLVLGAGGGSDFRKALTLEIEERSCVASMTCSAVGFGELMEAPATAASELSSAEFSRLSQAWGRTESALAQQLYGGYQVENRFPVLGEAISVPTRGLFLVLLVFVILVGPVNLAWASRRKRRMWLLWTVPALSVLTSLVVLAYALLADGVTRYERAQGITLLDQDRHVALSVGRVAFYAPLAPSDGLRFAPSTLLLTEETPDVYGRVLDWSREQHLQSGWIASRLPAHFIVRKVERRRERLEIRVTGNVLGVVNGLGADIRQLWLMDAEGALHVAVGGVAAGAQTQLVQAKGPEPGQRPRLSLRELFNGDWATADQRLAGQAEDWLVPGSYIAVLDGWPFLESALQDAEAARTGAVYGRFDASTLSLPAAAATSTGAAP